MEGGDQFNKDCGIAAEMGRRISELFKKRGAAAAEGKSILKFESLISGQVDQLNIQLTGLERQIAKAESAGLVSQIVQKRRGQIRELRNGYLQYKAQLQELRTRTEAHPGRGLEEVKGPAEVHVETQTLIQKQEDKLDEIHGVIKSIKHAGQAIGQEADVHNDLLGISEKEMEIAQEEVSQAEGRLKKLVKNSSSCCLWTLIIMELVAIVLIIFWMIQNLHC